MKNFIKEKSDKASTNFIAARHNSGRSLSFKESVKSSFSNTFLETQKPILNNHILDSLPHFDLARLMPHLDFVALSSGREIYSLDENINYIYFPETAVVSDICDLKDGSMVETAMTGNEGATGTCAILGVKITTHRSQVIISGNAWRIKLGTLKEEILKSEKLQTLIFEFINRHMNQISQRLICKSFHVIERRLCSWLLMLEDRSKVKQLSITQENAALLLGSQRPSITLAAQTLRKKKLIDYTRGGISILDRRKMETLACECYTTFQGKPLSN